LAQALSFFGKMPAAMDGQILAEFSNLNALNPKANPAFSTSSKDFHRASQPDRQASPAGRTDTFVNKEKLLRGESTYTAASSGGRSNENFIEDQPAGVQLGVSHLLPKASTSEERERLLRRLEMCAKAREESTKIMSIHFALRDAVKNDNAQERKQYVDKMLQTQRARDERWGRKLQRSPFAVDLVAENQRIDEENRVSDHIEKRRQRILAKRNRETHNAIFKRATAETDELEQQRAEKRMLLENERQLKALRQVLKSNARTAQILQERKRQQMQKQQAQLQQVVNGPQEPPFSAGKSGR